MKKLFNLLVILFIAIGSSTFVSAQTNTASQTTKAQHTKSDGTVDKRFKENRKVKPVVIPTKKDGTPDMRYKASKSAATKANNPKM